MSGGAGAAVLACLLCFGAVAVPAAGAASRARSAQTVISISRLERPDHTFAMAVMTDGDPTMRYGIDTIAGVTSALISTP